MDKPIPEAVSVTLHQDRAGCEWFIITSKEHPDSESEVTPSDDPALFDLLKSLTASLQQGQAVAFDRMLGSPAYPDARTDPFNALCTAPPSVEEVRNLAMRLQLSMDASTRDIADQILDALAQQPAAVAVDVETLPEFLDRIARELVERDTHRDTFAAGIASSLRGRALVLRAAQHQEPMT